MLLTETQAKNMPVSCKRGSCQASACKHWREDPDHLYNHFFDKVEIRRRKPNGLTTVVVGSCAKGKILTTAA